MTTQVGEILIYENVEYRMKTVPLYQYLASLTKKYNFGPTFTCCWRGYIGTWEIIDDKLYLVSLSGTTDEGIDFNIELLFPGQKKVFADWYTGELVVPIGEILQYYDARYGSVHEENLFLEIEKGILIKRLVISNKDNIVKSNGEHRTNKDQMN